MPLMNRSGWVWRSSVQAKLSSRSCCVWVDFRDTFSLTSVQTAGLEGSFRRFLLYAKWGIVICSPKYHIQNYTKEYSTMRCIIIWLNLIWFIMIQQCYNTLNTTEVSTSKKKNTSAMMKIKSSFFICSAQRLKVESCSQKQTERLKQAVIWNENSSRWNSSLSVSEILFRCRDVLFLLGLNLWE